MQLHRLRHPHMRRLDYDAARVRRPIHKHRHRAYLLRARTYDPATAQFLSVDPAGPITRAPYTYAGDNPLNGRDNRGLDIELGIVSIPTPNLEEVGNFAAGFGDTLTFGATQWVREELGINNVDTCSSAYQAGGYGGLATGVLIPGEGEALGAGDIAAGAIQEGDVLGAAERWLGEGYREIASGVYRSADDARQFRATPSDLGAAQPHVHLNRLDRAGKAILRMLMSILGNGEYVKQDERLVAVIRRGDVELPSRNFVGLPPMAPGEPDTRAAFADPAHNYGVDPPRRHLS